MEDLNELKELCSRRNIDYYKMKQHINRLTQELNWPLKIAIKYTIEIVEKGWVK